MLLNWYDDCILVDEKTNNNSTDHIINDDNHYTSSLLFKRLDNKMNSIDPECARNVTIDDLKDLFDFGLCCLQKMSTSEAKWCANNKTISHHVTRTDSFVSKLLSFTVSRLIEDGIHVQDEIGDVMFHTDDCWVLLRFLKAIAAKDPVDALIKGYKHDIGVEGLKFLLPFAIKYESRLVSLHSFVAKCRRLDSIKCIIEISKLLFVKNNSHGISLLESCIENLVTRPNNDWSYLTDILRTGAKFGVNVLMLVTLLSNMAMELINKDVDSSIMKFIDHIYKASIVTADEYKMYDSSNMLLKLYLYLKTRSQHPHMDVEDNGLELFCTFMNCACETCSTIKSMLLDPLQSFIRISNLSPARLEHARHQLLFQCCLLAKIEEEDETFNLTIKKLKISSEVLSKDVQTIQLNKQFDCYNAVISKMLCNANKLGLDRRCFVEEHLSDFFNPTPTWNQNNMFVMKSLLDALYDLELYDVYFEVGSKFTHTFTISSSDIDVTYSIVAELIFKSLMKESIRANNEALAADLRLKLFMIKPSIESFIEYKQLSPGSVSNIFEAYQACSHMRGNVSNIYTYIDILNHEGRYSDSLQFLKGLPQDDQQDSRSFFHAKSLMMWKAPEKDILNYFHDLDLFEAEVALCLCLSGYNDLALQMCERYIHSLAEHSVQKVNYWLPIAKEVFDSMEGSQERWQLLMKDLNIQ
ncbi:hypothetical protein AKO1_008622 [Acrasis kona]|uniref:Uncharacterized protein n=1 Tax=Acrasis kona TaxID=1008807 RepID=A0AAW2YM94_9EUKA